MTRERQPACGEELELELRGLIQYRAAAHFLDAVDGPRAYFPRKPLANAVPVARLDIRDVYLPVDENRLSRMF